MTAYSFEMLPSTPTEDMLRSLREQALALLQPAPPDAPADEAYGLDASDAADVAIHAGAWVLYAAPNNGFRFEGKALMYDAATDRWLTEWRDCLGTRVDWLGVERLTLVLTAEVAAMIGNGVAS
jgi:hypothetical protein